MIPAVSAVDLLAKHMRRGIHFCLIDCLYSFITNLSLCVVVVVCVFTFPEKNEQMIEFKKKSLFIFTKTITKYIHKSLSYSV